MGRIFLTYLCGSRLFLCGKCHTPISSEKELRSTNFVGSTGRAYLFSHAVNIRESQVDSRMMTTGRHLVRDVYCKNCSARLGWMYEYAMEIDQMYKEGCVILERSLFKEVENKVEMSGQCGC